MFFILRLNTWLVKVMWTTIFTVYHILTILHSLLFTTYFDSGVMCLEYSFKGVFERIPGYHSNCVILRILETTLQWSTSQKLKILTQVYNRHRRKTTKDFS